MPVNLTANAITVINGGDLSSKPLVQVVDIKLIGSVQERYRLLLSDSVSTQHAMLATQLNDRARLGHVLKGSVVQLMEYICSTVQSRKIIVVLNFETIIPECEIIGNPRLVIDAPAQKQMPGDGNPMHSACDKLISEVGGGGNNMQRFRPALGTGNQTQSFRPPMMNSQKPNSNLQSARPGFSSQGQNHGSNAQSFRPTVQPSYQPSPSYKNLGAIMKNEAPARIIPISALNPYQGRWAIKARVTAKGDIRRYNNARGDGKVFSSDLLDSDGGEIRVTCFNAVVDRFYNVIEVGRVYVISKGGLKPAQKNFNHLKNEWEIFLEATSTVDLCPDEDSSIPQQQFSFRPISEIENAESNSIFDVIGIVTSVNPSVPILRKNGLETQRRVLNLKDSSGRIVELTLWGDFCNKDGQMLQEMVDSGIFPVLAVKAGKVSDFSGKSLGTISSSQLFINPDIPEAHNLKDWYDRGGRDMASVSISREMMPGGSKNEIRKTVSQIRDEGLGRSDKPDWVTVSGTLIFIKADSFCYTACPLTVGDRQCNKKVTRSGNSRWQCDRCNQEFDDCDYRYLLQVQIQDHTGIMWATAFQEAGEDLVGCPAKELYSLKHNAEDDAGFGSLLRGRLFGQYMFRLKIKEETYGDEQRVKTTIVKADKLDYAAHSRHLLDLVSKDHMR